MPLASSIAAHAPNLTLTLAAASASSTLATAPLAFAARWLGVCLLAALAYWVISLRIFHRRSKRPAANRGMLLLALLLVAFAGASLAIAGTFGYQTPVFFLPIAGFFLLFFYLFPDKRYTPAWIRWLVFVYGITQISALAPPKPPSTNPQESQFISNWQGLLSGIAFAGDAIFVMILVLGIAPQIYRRYRRINDSAAFPRIPLRTLALLGAAAAIAIFLLLAVEALLTQSPAHAPSFAILCLRTCFFLLTTLIPVALGFTLLRGHPLDRDALLNRVLIYGTLTISLLLIYAATTVLNVFAPGLLEFPFIFVFLVLVVPFMATIFRPLHARIRDIVDRRFFRRRYDAAQTLAAFRGSLRAETNLDQLSKALAAAVQKALQPRTLALWLRATSSSTAQRGVSAWAAPLLAAATSPTTPATSPASPAMTPAPTAHPQPPTPAGRAAGDLRLHRQASASAAPGVAPTPNLAVLDVMLDEPLRLSLLNPAPDGIDLARLPDSPASRAWRADGTALLLPLASRSELVGVVALGAPTSAPPYTVDERELLADTAESVAPVLVLAQEKRDQDLLTRERERVEQELQTARRIQEALLPKNVPTLGGWQLATLYQPAREVGGDFYDFLSLPDGKLGIVLGDVTDKGMPAALVMATTRSMLRAVATQQSVSPSQVLAHVNELLCPDLPASMFVTCFYAILDPRSGNLRFANAGQDLPYLRHAAGTVCELRARGMPLGLMPGMSYEEQDVSLAPGDSILFYSDGLVEAHNAEREMFGFPRLSALLAAHAGGPPPIVVLLRELADFTGPEWEQEDDITLVTLQRLPVADADAASPAASEPQAVPAVQSAPSIPA